MTLLNNLDRSKIRFHWQQMTAIPITYTLENLINTYNFSTEDYNRLTTLIDNCELFYTYTTNPPLIIVNNESLSQNIIVQTVRPSSTTTTTYGNRASTKKRRMTQNEANIQYSQACRGLFKWLNSFI